MRVRYTVIVLCSLACTKPATPDVDTTTAGADASCELVSQMAHPDGAQLLQEFVERDARGEFTASSNWFNGAVTCPGHEPGPDRVTVAKGYQFRIIDRARDSVRAEVVWERLGYRGGADSTVAPGIDYDTLVALRTEYGWRVLSPVLDPHVPVTPRATRP